MAIYTSNYTKNEIDEGVGLGLSSPLNIYKSIVAAICASSIDGFTVTETTNAEWDYVLTDSEDRVIAGVRTDGSLFVADIDSRGTMGLYTIAQINNAVALANSAYQKPQGGIPSSDLANNVIPGDFGASGTNHAHGFVPDPGSTQGNTKYLREDGTWAVPAGGSFTQEQADWNQTNNSAVDYIKNKPTIPTVPTNVSAFTNDVGYLTSHQDISGKEDVTAIVASVNATDATLPITTLTTEAGKYYRIDVAVETLAVTLPAMTDATKVKTVVLYLTGGTTPAVTISSTAPSGGTAPAVHFSDGYAIESGNTYEVNCAWNGLAWIVASFKINTSNS